MNLEATLLKIVKSDTLHAKWLNTLSFLENCGARKIASCEHPTLVKEEMLKHAAEEFRHAHYLKKQIQKISISSFPDYSFPSLLGGMATFHYLNKLDLFTCRHLTCVLGLTPEKVKERAYLLVSYAIEVRAQALYPLYDKALREVGAKIFVKSIVLEEQEHLKEMVEGLKKIPSGLDIAKIVCRFEQKFYRKWMRSIKIELKSTSL